MIERGARGAQRQRSRETARQAGFSLFELVVFVLCVAIMYSYAAQRFMEYPGEAERANFLAVTTQLQSSIALQTVTAQLKGGVPQLSSSLAGANPMRLLLSAPRNYRGEMSGAEAQSLPRRTWYFDTDARELVYRVGDGDGVLLIEPAGTRRSQQIRLAIVARYSQVERSTGLPLDLVGARAATLTSAEIERSFEGLVLAPVIPYEWGSATNAEALRLAGANGSERQ